MGFVGDTGCGFLTAADGFRNFEPPAAMSDKTDGTGGFAEGARDLGTVDPPAFGAADLTCTVAGADGFLLRIAPSKFAGIDRTAGFSSSSSDMSMESPPELLASAVDGMDGLDAVLVQFVIAARRNFDIVGGVLLLGERSGGRSADAGGVMFGDAGGVMFGARDGGVGGDTRGGGGGRGALDGGGGAG